MILETIAKKSSQPMLKVSFAVIAISENKVSVFKETKGKIRKSDLKDAPENLKQMKRDYPTKVANFSDPKKAHEKEIIKYLRAIDRAITKNFGRSLKILIVAGSKTLIHKLEHISKNNNRIKFWIEGNFDRISAPKMLETVNPYIDKYLNEIENTAMEEFKEHDYKKVSVGIHEVLKSARSGKIQALLIEKSFHIKAAEKGEKETEKVNLLLDLVTKAGGNIVVMQDGKLDEFSGIVSVNRY